jgi:dihydroorotate dehydrogenase electron transfer subunit
MRIEEVSIISNDKLSKNTFSLKFRSNVFSNEVKPGQFFNIKIEDDRSFILRRPFSVAQVENDLLEIIFDVVGLGTEYLSRKKIGEIISVLGPLGNGFDYEDNFDTAVIIGGGIGIAPFPYLVKKLEMAGKKYQIFFGFKSIQDKIELPIHNINYSTDDGSFGFRGTVIDLFKETFKWTSAKFLKIFACGPNAMLRSISDLSEQEGINAEVSIESYMACGFGICQGCPVEAKNQKDKYFLVCKDGPCFNTRDINL